MTNQEALKLERHDRIKNLLNNKYYSVESVNEKGDFVKVIGIETEIQSEFLKKIPAIQKDLSKTA
jgi:hypothetical protein